jgi:carboxyl-terminal processing protease
MVYSSYAFRNLVFWISSSFIATAIVFLSDLHSGYGTSISASQENPKVVVDEVWHIINSTFIDGTFNHTDWQATRQQLLNIRYGSKAQAYDAIEAALKKLNDPYTRFLNPQEFSELKQEASGELSGAGARMYFNPITKELIITETFANSPALKSGLKPGDRVLAVDGKTVQGLDASKTIALGHLILWLSWSPNLTSTLLGLP